THTPSREGAEPSGCTEQSSCPLSPHCPRRRAGPSDVCCGNDATVWGRHPPDLSARGRDGEPQHARTYGVGSGNIITVSRAIAAGTIRPSFNDRHQLGSTSGEYF